MTLKIKLELLFTTLNTMYMLILLTVSGLAVCSPIRKGVDRIVNGEEIDITAAPYQVSIVYGGKHSCGGSIISNDLILTAAHCITTFSLIATDYSVRVGSTSRFNGGDLYPVGDYELHKEFTTATMNNDIAIMWLKKPIQFKEGVAPVELFERGEELHDGDMTIITGWGKLLEAGYFAENLQMVTLPVIDPITCQKYYASKIVTRNMICAGLPEGGRDSCQGDSGGPLVYNGRLAGVVSWGIGCARPKQPGVYTKVSALRKWIDENSYYLRHKHIYD